MTANQASYNHAEALADHLADRVRTAAQALIAASETIADANAPASGYTAAVIELRRLLDVLVEQAITYDLHSGPGLTAVAAALGVSERTVRSRYDGLPRDLPLLLALDER